MDQLPGGEEKKGWRNPGDAKSSLSQKKPEDRATLDPDPAKDQKKAPVEKGFKVCQGAGDTTRGKVAVSSVSCARVRKKQNQQKGDKREKEQAEVPNCT